MTLNNVAVSPKSLREALWDWCCRIWTNMREHASMGVPYVPPNGGSPLENVNVVASWPDPPEILWPLEIQWAVFHTPEWEAVQRALRSDPLSANQINELVGIATGKVVFHENTIAFWMFPTAEQFGAWLDGNDPDDLRERTFEAKYTALRDFLQCEEFTYEILTPLQGLDASQVSVPISLDETAEISRLSDDEIERLSAAGILKNPYFGGRIDRYSAPNNMRYTLRRTMRARKFVGDPSPDETCELTSLLYQPYSDVVRIRRAMAVALQGRVIVAAFVGRQLGWNPLGSGIRPAKSLVPTSVKNLPLTPISSDEVQIVRDLWVRLGDPAFSDNLALRIAVDRVASLGERHTPEDEILDIMIAADAHYFAGDSRRDEKGKRLACRVTAYADMAVLGTTEPELKSLMSRAWILRSSIAHGSSYDSKDFEIAPGTSNSIQDFIAYLERVVRLGLRRSLLAPALDAPPNVDWEKRFGVQ